MKLISLLTHHFIHTWATKHCQHCSERVHPCTSLIADWVFSLTTWDRTPNNFPCRWLGLAIFSLACPDLAAYQSPNSNTYKSHRYTSWQNTVRHSIIARQANIHTLFTFHTGHKHSTTAKQTYILISSHWRVEEACWACILLSGTSWGSVTQSECRREWSLPRSSQTLGAGGGRSTVWVEESVGVHFAKRGST